MSDLWSQRAQAMRESPTHREGPDLDLVVELCEPGPGVTALDVATGGGHVARRLREAGCNVVSADPAPGMQPDVICRAEDLPFADGSFDVVACRIAAHHFEDVAVAVQEMARVARNRMVVQDNLFQSEQVEEAERLHDPSHVRCYSEDEWRSFFAAAGLEVDALEVMRRRLPLEPWLERAETPPDDAARVRELLADRTEDGLVESEAIVIRGRKG
ncbi:MAG TPA: class I SAM-dependent methyltransferase [Gaiellaceae bacterium]|jgi:SAM-dependent methyltransferase|nr:class I SAM-dependent methyltransferase [Gaiellaceae bacterium]